MNILDKLFGEQAKQSTVINGDFVDLLLDWFKEAGVDINTFEQSIYYPIIKELRKTAYLDRFFTQEPDEAKQAYWTQLTIRYLISVFPSTKYLQMLLEMFHYEKMNYHFNDGIFNDRLFSELSSELQLKHNFINYTVPIIKLYYLVNFRQPINFNPKVELSNIIYDIFKLRKNHFEVYSDFVKTIHIIPISELPEKPYIFIKLLLSDNDSELFNSELNEELKIQLLKSIEEYNAHFADHLDYASIKFLYEIYKEIDIYQKGRKILPESVIALIDNNLKTNESKESFVQNFIYFSFYDSSLAYKFEDYKALFKLVTKDFILSKSNVEQLLDNSKKLIYSTLLVEVLIPLIEKIENEITFRDSLFVKLEDELISRMQHLPEKKGFALNMRILNRKKEQSFNEEDLFQLSYYRNCYSGIYTTIYDETNSNHPQISKLIEYLNVFFPCSLKTVYNSYSDDRFFSLNVNNKEVTISRDDMLIDINQLLNEKQVNYLFADFYLMYKNSHRDYYSMIYSYSFFSKDELIVYHNAFYNNLSVFKDNPSLKVISERHAAMLKFTHDKFGGESTIGFWNLYDANYQKTQNSQEATFENNIEWSWLKVNYLDRLTDKPKLWYALMDTMMMYKQTKKPQKKFLVSVETIVEKIGYDTYFKELSKIFSEASKDEVWWKNEKVKELMKSFMVTCSYLKITPDSLNTLRFLTEFYYHKIYGVGPRNTALGNFALECLVGSKSEDSFGHLMLMRNKTKYARFQKVIDKYIDKFISESELPEEELADKGIYGYDFNSQLNKIYTVNPYKLTISFGNKKMLKKWTDDNEKEIKKLPVDFTALHKDHISAILLELKNIEKDFKDIKYRVATYWINERVWNFDFWQKYILNNALINGNIQNLIWINKTKGTDFIVNGQTLYSLDNHEVVNDHSDLICLWHPILANEQNINAWQEYLWKHAIVQPEKQVFRENYHVSEEERTNKLSDFFANHFLEVNKLMAISNTRAWIFSYVHEGESWPRKYFRTQDVTVHLKTNYDRNDFAIPTKELIFTKGNTTKIDRYPLNLEPIQLKELSPIFISEVFRDLDLFVATTSISNNPNLALERQEMKSYYQNYEKSFFTENASSIIRKQILKILIGYLNLPSDGFEKNYILINGKNNTYKINLSSALVQIKSSAQYINIQPNLKTMKKVSKVRMPIEDDETLNLILSKIYFLIENEI